MKLSGQSLYEIMLRKAHRRGIGNKTLMSVSHSAPADAMTSTVGEPWTKLPENLRQVYDETAHELNKQYESLEVHQG